MTYLNFNDYLLISFIFFILWFVGYLINNLFLKLGQFEFLEKLFLNLITGLVLISLSGYCLAAASLFAYLPVFLLALFIILLLTNFSKKTLTFGEEIQNLFRFRAHARGRAGKPGTTKDTVNLLKDMLIITICFSALFTFSPVQFFYGGGDPGGYSLGGVNLARTGGFFYQDQELAHLKPEIQALFIRPKGNRYKSLPDYQFKYFFIEDQNQGKIAFPFLPLLSVLIGFSYLLVTLDHCLLILGIIAFTSLLAFAVFLKKHLSFPAVILSLLCLSFLMPQIVYQNISKSEILLQLLIWSSLAIFSIDKEKKQKHLAFLASITFALSFLARIDSVLAFFAYTLHAFFHLTFSKLKRTNIKASLIIFIGALISLTHQTTIAASYSLKYYEGFVFSPKHFIFLAIGGTVTVFLILILIFKRADRLNRLIKTALPLITIVILSLLGIRALFMPKDTSPFWLTAKYTHWLFPTVGFSGLVFWLKKEKHQNNLLFLFIFLFFTSFYFYHLFSTPPNRIWWIRRLAPVTFPGLAFFIGYLFQESLAISKKKISLIALPLLAVITVLLSINSTFTYLKNRSSHQHTVSDIYQLALEFDNQAIIVFQSSNFGHKMAPALKYIFDKKTFIIWNKQLDDQQTENLNRQINTWLSNGKPIWIQENLKDEITAKKGKGKDFMVRISSSEIIETTMYQLTASKPKSIN